MWWRTTTEDAVDLLDDLQARGLVHDHTDLDALRGRLDEGPITLYAGFDPTADSLHVGHLLPLLLLRRFQDAGHRPIALAGGATGLIGDPSGRSDERNLLDDDALAANVAGIRPQLESFLRFGSGPTGALLVDNRDWTQPIGVLDFLRDVGKHVTVNAMLAKESVRARVAGEHGISYTEFSYMLLQANDYWWLHEHEGCELQVGGSDQWGNITAGIDLARRRSGASVHGLTVPLLVKSDGGKFGKTADGAVWLDPARTTPFAFHQFLVQVDDADVEQLLLRLTLLPVDEVLAILEQHRADPRARIAQKLLARELTTIVHGSEATTEAEAVAGRFTAAATNRSAAELEAMAVEVPTTHLEVQEAVGVSIVDLVAGPLGVFRSKGEARRMVGEGGLYVNDERLSEDRPLAAGDLLHDRFVLIRRGRRQQFLLVVAPSAR
jgi:tyrosyl-tRNA synthetase